MATGIQWTDETWNPVTGCSKVSPGCAHCYAETVALRFWPTQYPKIPYETRHSTTGHVVRGERERCFTDVMCHEDRLDAPLHWKKPRRVFVNSMSDLFHEDVPDAFIDKVFAVMALARQHTFQILTKRAERMRAYMNSGWGFRVANELLPAAVGHLGAEVQVVGFAHKLGVLHQPLPNVWLGVSVENGKFRSRIAELQRTPAAVIFLSLEPLLEDLGDLQIGAEWCAANERPIDWVIVGGESGLGARPCDLAWVRSIVAQCRTAGVPVFVKQLGANVAGDEVVSKVFEPFVSRRRVLHDKKGGDPAEWPTDLQVREFPEVRA